MTQLATTVDFDETRAEAFAERLFETLSSAALSMMISIGHRTQLFDALDGAPPLTSDEIAARAGLHERYVREWLGAMTTGRIVEYDPAQHTYRLPDEHAAFLTRRARPNNIAANMQFTSVLGSVEDDVVESFRHGGGVDYCRFHRFHDVMAAESDQTVVAGLIDTILPLAAGAIDKLRRGIDVLDVGCGSGWALCEMAGAFPASRFTGYDLCEDAIANGKRRAQERGLRNVRFEVRDVTSIGKRDAFDLITAFDAIHDQKDPAAVLGQIHAALRSGGTFLMQDIRASSHLEKNMDNPVATFLYSISTMHCMTVSLAQGGAGLGTCWGEELAIEMLTDAGFSGIEVRTLEHDVMNNFYVMGK
jgi:2-polyprenyl-3-methyl-5-hydroxy-6-metoxy-1,4-benzoquinol methylase